MSNTCVHLLVPWKIPQFSQFIQQYSIYIVLDKQYQKWSLKYPKPKLTKTWINFIKDCMLYYILKSIPWLLQQSSENLVLKYSLRMKNKYRQIVQNNQNEDFDFKIIICIKIIGDFLDKNINDLKVDIWLQSQIYGIIIANILGTLFHNLGINVQRYTYKYLYDGYKNKNQISKIKFNKNQNIQSSKVTTDTLRTNSQKINNSNQSTMKKVQKFKNNKKKSQFNRVLNPSCYIDDFKAQVLESLYVKPVPKLIQKKLRLTDHSKQYYSENKRNINLTLNLQQKTLKNSYSTIKSTQLSKALQFTTTFNLNNQKTFTFHCKSQFNKQNNNSFREKSNQTKRLQQQNLNNSKQIKHLQQKYNWKNIAKKLKNNISKIQSQKWSLNIYDNVSSDNKIKQQIHKNKQLPIIQPYNQKQKQQQQKQTNQILSTQLDDVFKKYQYIPLDLTIIPENQQTIKNEQKLQKYKSSFHLKLTRRQFILKQQLRRKIQKQQYPVVSFIIK